MDVRIAKWIDSVLSELSRLDKDQGRDVLHACGKECFKGSELCRGALVIREKYPKENDPCRLLELFKSGYYNSDNFYWKENEITLILEECTCPLVKAGVGDPYLCNCTRGYSKTLFETLLSRSVEVELEQSILAGDTVCKQRIKIS